MTRYALLCCLIFMQCIVSAQNFEPKDTLEFENIANPVYEWMDVNNDGLLDILITGQDQLVTNESNSLSLVYLQQADTTFMVQAIDFETFGEQHLRIADLNRDGKQDLLIAATNGTNFEHAIYENNGDLTWNKVVINTGITYWQELRLADMDNDGMPEIISASAEGLEIFKHGQTDWESVTLPEEIVPIITDPVVADFDKDGYLDLLLLGQDAEEDSVAWWLINKQEIEFTIQTVESDSLQIVDYVVSDFNEDGLPDVFYSTAANSRDRSLQVLLKDNEDDFQIFEDANRLALKNARVFAADLTSDGLLDTDIEGAAPGPGDGLISREWIIQETTGTTYVRDTLENTAGQGRRYGDYEFDGDLDYFEVTVDGNAGRIWLFENITETKNEGPDGLEDLLTFRFQDQFYIVWNKADDDFTEAKSVTYDVAVGTTAGSADIVASGFNPATLKRQIVGPGNQGYNDFMILKDVPQGPLAISIMPLDNAFHYDVSECLQGTATPCGEEILAKEIQLCGEEFLELQTATGEVARWFSFEGGYLGTTSTIGLNIAGDDFVIAVYDRVGGCIDGEVFDIRYDPGLPNLGDIGVCAGDEANVTITGIWESITWTSAAQGEVSTTNALNYTPTANDVITVNATTARGCSYQTAFNVNVSEFVGAVESAEVQVGEGESVQLRASGGDRYLWLPANGLSNNQIADPIASPDQTTEYTVFIFSDDGCAAELTVLVEVIQTAFAPEAFSPNGDGRNERFRIYDLEGPVSMTFIIFDRAGNRVFETSIQSEIAGSGWDGTNNGNPVPAGTYFWKVNGTYSDGQKILINGDTKGAVQLIR